jgi:hypothetical protein
VIDFKGFQAPRDAGGRTGCAIDGSVHNVSRRPVTVRIGYRGVDQTGSIASASARIPWVAPGESRSFASSPFRDATGQIVGCPALGSVQMVEAVADPAEP